jgi:serine/threonine-protein kinase
MSLEQTILEENISDDESFNNHSNNFYFIEKEELIGTGAGSEVWLGFRITPYDYERIAVKVYSRKHSLNSLRREVNLAKALSSHDGIGRIFSYDFDKISKKGQVLMEYISGNNLSDVMKKHRNNFINLHFPQRLAAFIGFECSKSLDYAHKTIVYDEKGKNSIGLIHRDISPQNIIITQTGYPKIIDFGLGILSSDVGEKEIIGKVAGKLGFIAPEMFEKKQIDFSADIYSLGMTIDYLIRGRNPLLDGIDCSADYLSSLNIVMNNMQKGFNTLKEENKYVDGELSAIISKAVESDLNKRYKTMEDFHRDITDYLYVRGPTKLGPTREALQNYIEFINTPGFESNIFLLISGKEFYFHEELKRKFEKLRELVPYMNKAGKFCLERITKNDEEGFIYL